MPETVGAATAAQGGKFGDSFVLWKEIIGRLLCASSCPNNLK